MDPVNALCSNMGDFFAQMQQMMLRDNTPMLCQGRRGPILSPDFLHKMAEIHSQLDSVILASDTSSELAAFFRYMSSFTELSINHVVNPDGQYYSTSTVSTSVYHEKKKKRAFVPLV